MDAMRWNRLFRAAVAFLLVNGGCHKERDRSTPAQSVVNSGPLRFRSQELPFRYERGETGSAWPVETTGGGVGLLDYDNDGWLDLFFAQGGALPAGKTAGGPPSADVLLRNLGDGRFEDVSSRAGLTPKGYGQGVAVADYDGDGDPDVYVTRYGRNTLWRNDRGGFTDVTTEAGVGCGLWSLGAAFADYDGDGDLDLFVATYFTFDPAKAPFHHDPVTRKADYGMPASFPGQPDVLYRNEGNGRFTDVTALAGVAGNGRGMGVLASDVDGDGRIDFLVANDMMHNALWCNRGDGTFEDRAEVLGVAVNGDGHAEANMGIAFGDSDDDTLPDIMITHFWGEHDALWRARGGDGATRFYQDQTNEAGLAADTHILTGWGTCFADFDLDGRLDLVAANGHIRRERVLRYPYENPPILWRNAGAGRFANVTDGAGDYFRTLHIGRGLACGDLDDDGDLDLVIVHHHAPSVILWNDTPRRGNWLIVKLKGRAPNRDAIGTQLTALVGPRTIVRSVDGGGSYISASDPRVHLGLGEASVVDRLDVRWPSGRVESRSNLPVNSVVEWAEGE